MDKCKKDCRGKSVMESRNATLYQITLTNREVLQADGVLEVESFNENQITAISKLGVLVIKGEGLHIVQLNLEDGKMLIEGKINSILYVENKKAQVRQRGKGIIERLLK
ncbi:MAG: sporulation protein YabP [Firmicutes bacterium HGW-Firmicutes-12]|jgi:sporulation protein YabP|nr:MAG: sporulation protein YabP [Firmicutes bacterium HGW-Firmicutes-12]